MLYEVITFGENVGQHIGRELAPASAAMGEGGKAGFCARIGLSVCHSEFSCVARSLALWRAGENLIGLCSMPYLETVTDLSPENLARYDAIIDVRSPAEFADVV